eukprot:m.124209 g.124209  ORF g.124209 m.124209 type:complete len:529 (-) comp29045_c0_seq1:87-1673(-)
MAAGTYMHSLLLVAVAHTVIPCSLADSFYTNTSTVTDIGGDELQRLSNPMKQTRFDLKLIEFYAPWCGHCQHFKPAYISAADSIAKTFKDVHFYAVDCVKYREVCTEWKVEGYPDLRMFVQSKWVTAKADSVPLTPVGVIEWVKTQRASACSTLANPHMCDSAVIPQTAAVDGIAVALIPQVNNVGAVAVPVVVAANDDGGGGKGGGGGNGGGGVAKLHARGALRVPKSPLAANVNMGSVSQPSKGKPQMADILATVEFALANDLQSRFLATSAASADHVRTFLQTVYEALPGSAHQKRLLQDAREELSARGKTATATEYQNGLDKLATYRNKYSNFCAGESRQFTCGLWTIFHAMLINARDDRHALQLGHFIINFIATDFRCTYCRDHFAKMVLGENGHPAWNSIDKSHESVVLWFWKSHNAVNVRLGKGVFPSALVCPSLCRNNNGTFREKGILSFMKEFYSFNTMGATTHVVDALDDHGSTYTHLIIPMSACIMLVTLLAVLKGQAIKKMILCEQNKKKEKVCMA